MHGPSSISTLIHLVILTFPRGLLKVKTSLNGRRALRSVRARFTDDINVTGSVTAHEYRSGALELLPASDRCQSVADSFHAVSKGDLTLNRSDPI